MKKLKKIIDEVFKTYSNKTIIFVSHNKKNLRYCNKLIEINNKRLTQKISKKLVKKILRTYQAPQLINYEKKS